MALFVVAITVASGSGGASSVAPTAWAVAPHSAASLRSPVSPAAPAPAARPAGSSNFTGNFFSNDLNVATVPPSNLLCPTTTFFCLNESQDPSVLALSNGAVGVGFSMVSNYTASTCGAAGSESQIAFARSTDGGATFAPYQFISNVGPAGCPYYEGIEPSFATSSTGEIFGAYVETNASLSDMLGTGNPRPTESYTTRAYDALAIVNSTNDGTSFSPTQTILGGGNISQPQVATFGRSVYIVYENISNGTTRAAATLGSYYFYTYYAVSLQLVYSTDAGHTWKGPIALPGHLPGALPGQNNTVTGPSISVNSNGQVAVGFAANRSCYQWCATAYATYGYDIVVDTSTTNGTSWKGPYVVATGATENDNPGSGLVGTAIWQQAVQTVVRYDPAAPTHLFIAWSQSVNMSLTDAYAYYYDFYNDGIFGGASTDSGVLWNTSAISPAQPPLDPFTGEDFGMSYIEPSLAISNGTAYVGYGHYNWTNGGTGYGAYSQNAFAYDSSYWLTTTTNGKTWATPSIVMRFPIDAITYFDYWGVTGSIATNTTTGAPIIAYALMTAFLSFNFTTFKDYTAVVLGVAVPFSGATTTLEFQETGLAPGATWKVQVQGAIYAVTTPTFNITNAPVGETITVDWPGPIQFTGYRTTIQPTLSAGPFLTVATGTVVTLNFSKFYGLEINVAPGNDPYIDLSIYNFGPSNPYQFTYYQQTNIAGGIPYFYSGGAPFPWYFAAGTKFTFSQGGGVSYYYTYGFIGYSNGTGNGSYTGTSSAPTITLDGPINETFWMAAAGTYNESFGAPGLPSSSTFSFGIDGSSYSGTGGGTVIARNLTTGAYLLSNIAATSSKAGWEYFGFSEVGNPIVIPDEPSVNLSFAYVNVAAAAGTVSYRAAGLPNGSVWHLSFNGTEYSSDTPWINLTERPGTYPVAAYPAVSGSANATFAPTGIGSGGSVVPGSTYDVNFTPAYNLEVLGSAGGTVSPAGGSYWLAPGTFENFTATPASGYSFLGWSGEGVGSYTGTNLTAQIVANGPITETASFAPLNPARFNVTVSEQGLPVGTEWTAFLNGVGYSTTNSTLVVPDLLSCTSSGSKGDYGVTIPWVHANGSGERYVPTSYQPSVCGGGAPDLIQFATQFALTVTAGTGGSASASVSGPSPASPYWVPAGSQAILAETPDTGYLFAGWIGSGPGNYTGASSAPGIIPTGPVTEVAEFTPAVSGPPPTYTLTLTASPVLSAGTLWSVTVNGSGHSSTTTSLVVSGLLSGTYTVDVATATSPDGSTLYTPVQASISVPVHANGSQAVGFSTSYWVSLTAVGPGSVSPASGWVASGRSITIAATPTGTALFVGWAGNGDGQYSGTSSTTTITVHGPISEVASFARPAPPPPATTSSTGFLGSTTALALFAIIGLVVGLGVAAVLFRRRRSPPIEGYQSPAPTAEPPPGDAPPEEGSP